MEKILQAIVKAIVLEMAKIIVKNLNDSLSDIRKREGSNNERNAS